jgi:hypothetical protein
MMNSEPSIVEAISPSPTTPSEPIRDPSQAAVLSGSDKKESDTEDIYLDLDAIIDTRMGTLAKIDPKHAVAALDSGNYHKRMTDTFAGVSKEEFRQVYAERDLDTLRLSVLSNVVFFLRRLVKDSLVSSIMHQRVEKMCFTVNVWPYNFDDPGLVEMLIGCIRFHTYSTSSVRIISIPDEELTPDYCAKNFQIMIRYNWVNWMNKHKAFFEKRGIPNLTLVVPEMFYDEVPTEEDIHRLELRKHNPFKMTEEITAPLIRLKHMPVSLFSIHEAITKTTAETIIKRVEVTQEDIEEFLAKSHPKAKLVQETPLPVVDLDHVYKMELSHQDELL